MPDLMPPPSELLTNRKIRKASDEYLKFATQLEDALRRADALVDNRHLAVQEDAQATGDALRAGGKGPGDRHTVEVDRAIVAAQREANALAIAAADCETAVFAAVEAEGPGVLAELAARRAEIAGDQRSTLDVLGATERELRRLAALERWLAQPGRAYFDTGSLPVAWSNGQGGLYAQEGHLHWAQVLALLRDSVDTSSPEPVPTTTGAAS